MLIQNYKNKTMANVFEDIAKIEQELAEKGQKIYEIRIAWYNVEKFYAIYIETIDGE